ncbi:MAG: glycosyltransferase [Chitinophagaceae bacterium]|nr:MAG: glycosyltransferase [Chitinophagaceae bacterium]
MNVLILYGPHEAPAIQDIYFNNPFRILERREPVYFNLVEISKLTWDRIYEYSLVIVSRVFTQQVPDLIHFCNRAGKPILFFFDDDILNFPIEYYLDNEPFYKNNEQLIIEILKKSSALVVSTEKLKQTYSGFNDIIYVTPPCLNNDFVEQHAVKTGYEAQSPVFTIGYAGSFGHVIDFRFMEKALLDFYEENYPKVRLEFMGVVPEAFSKKLSEGEVSLVHWQPDYAQYFKNILQAKWDLALCPVIDSSYTSHKTNVKFLEYSSSRIPGIYSDITIYSGDIQEGVNGFLAKNDYDSWKRKIDFAFENRSSLQAVGNAGYDYVTKHFSNVDSADRWHSILEVYRKKGLARYKELFAIYWHKVKRFYSVKGLKGVWTKAKRFLRRISISSRLRSQPDSQVSAALNLEYELIFKKIEDNFDKKIIRKQVLFVVPWLSVGGGDMVNLNIAEGLDPERYSLHFITTEKSSHEWEPRFRKITKNIFHVRAALDEAEHFWEYNNLVLEYIRRSNPDIIFVSNSAIGYTCLPAIRDQFPHIRIVDILHGQGGAREGGGFPEFSKPYDSFIETRVTINEYLRNFMIGKYGIGAQKFRVIHNCIDTDKFQPAENRRKEVFTVKFIGRLTYEKHPEKVIEIAEVLSRKLAGEKLIFEIIGDGPMYNELDQRVKSRELTSIVKLKGYRDDIREQLMGADALVLCSEMEGLPIVLLEAMSMAVPCVSTRVGGIPELIDHTRNGFLVDPGNEMVNAFATHIYSLYKDRSLYRTIGNAARDKILDQFSIKKMASAYVDLINNRTDG